MSFQVPSNPNHSMILCSGDADTRRGPHVGALCKQREKRVELLSATKLKLKKDYFQVLNSKISPKVGNPACKGYSK